MVFWPSKNNNGITCPFIICQWLKLDFVRHYLTNINKETVFPFMSTTNPFWTVGKKSIKGEKIRLISIGTTTHINQGCRPHCGQIKHYSSHPNAERGPFIGIFANRFVRANKWCSHPKAFSASVSIGAHINTVFVHEAARIHGHNKDMQIAKIGHGIQRVFYLLLHL